MTVRFTAGSTKGLEINEETRLAFEAQLKEVSGSDAISACYEPEARVSRRSGKEKGPGFYSILFDAEDKAIATELVGQALLNIGSPSSLCGSHCRYT